MCHQFRRCLKYENLESRRLLTADWTNLSLPLDVNGSGLVSSLDALIIINDLNSGGTRPLTARGPEVVGAKIDVNADRILNAMDALMVINALNEFNMPMTLDVNSQEVPSHQVGMAESGNSVFIGVTLPRSVIRLEEVIDGVSSLKSNLIAKGLGEFHFELSDESGDSLFRLIATDVLGRSERLEFTFDSSGSLGVTGGQLNRHFPIGIGAMAPNRETA